MLNYIISHILYIYCLYNNYIDSSADCKAKCRFILFWCVVSIVATHSQGLASWTLHVIWDYPGKSPAQAFSNSISICKMLDYWSEGYEFKCQHCHAATTGPLSKDVNLQLLSYINEIKVALATVCHVFTKCHSCRGKIYGVTAVALFYFLTSTHPVVF